MSLSRWLVEMSMSISGMEDISLLRNRPTKSLWRMGSTLVIPRI